MSAKQALIYFSIRAGQINGSDSGIFEFKIISNGNTPVALAMLILYEGRLYQSIYLYSSHRGHGIMSEYVKHTTIPFITSDECGLSDWFKSRNVPHIVVPLGLPVPSTIYNEHQYIPDDKIAEVDSYVGSESNYIHRFSDRIYYSSKLLFRTGDLINGDKVRSKPILENDLPFLDEGVTYVRQGIEGNRENNVDLTKNSSNLVLCTYNDGIAVTMKGFSYHINSRCDILITCITRGDFRCMGGEFKNG